MEILEKRIKVDLMSVYGSFCTAVPFSINLNLL